MLENVTDAVVEAVHGAAEVAHEAGHAPNPTIVAVNWIGFLILFGSSMLIAYKLMTFPGPSEAPEDYFFGYREAKMLPVYVNLFAAIAYWLKVSAHANGNVGYIEVMDSIKYAEYIFTCPILTIDLLWTLNLPYKFTFGANILICIVCATFSSLFEAPARYMWFSLGSIIFGATWWAIVWLTRQRLEQFYSSHEYTLGISKATKNMLRTALFSYFSLWCVYPALWILLEVGLINKVVSHCLHVLLDVSAKSAYGFAMLKFQLSSERNEFLLDPLQKKLTPIEAAAAAAAVAASKLAESDPEAGGGDAYNIGKLPPPPLSVNNASTSRPSSPRLGPRPSRASGRITSPELGRGGGGGFRGANPGLMEPDDFPYGEDPRPPRRLSIRQAPGSPARRPRRGSMEAPGGGGGADGDGATMAQIQALNEQLTRLLRQQQQQGGGGGGGMMMGGAPGRSRSPGGGAGDEDDWSLGGGGENLRWTRPGWDASGGGGEPMGTQMSHRRQTNPEAGML